MGDNVVLKVLVKRIDDGMEKNMAMQFDGSMRFDEVLYQIRESLIADNKGHHEYRDHTLYWPEKMVFPLLYKTINFYDMKSGTQVILKKRQRPVKILFGDGAYKSLYVDFTFLVKDIISSLCEALNISGTEQMGLVAEPEAAGPLSQQPAQVDSEDKDKVVQLPSGRPSLPSLRKRGWIVSCDIPWLHPDKYLAEQGFIECNCFQLRFRCFNKLLLTKDVDSKRLEYLFGQAKDGFLDNHWASDVNVVPQFSGLIAQISFGDFKTDVHTPNFYPRKENTCLCPGRLAGTSTSTCKSLSKKIMKAHSLLKGISVLKCKFRFVKLWEKQQSYGYDFYNCIEKKTMKPALIGVSCQRILFVPEDPKREEMILPLENLMKWLNDADTVTLQFTSAQLLLIIKGLGIQVASSLSACVNLVLSQLHIDDDEDGGENLLVDDGSFNPFEDDFHSLGPEENFANPLI